MHKKKKEIRLNRTIQQLQLALKNAREENHIPHAAAPYKLARPSRPCNARRWTQAEQTLQRSPLNMWVAYYYYTTTTC